MSLISSFKYQHWASEKKQPVVTQSKACKTEFEIYFYKFRWWGKSDSLERLLVLCPNISGNVHKTTCKKTKTLQLQRKIQILNLNRPTQVHDYNPSVLEKKTFTSFNGKRHLNEWNEKEKLNMNLTDTSFWVSSPSQISSVIKSKFQNVELDESQEFF